MFKTIETNEKIGAVAPKILKWDFENNKKTDIIDSYGIVCDRKFRFRDDSQGQQDTKANIKNNIFGFTGAAVMFNLKALKDIAFDNEKYLEYFDELMFMYKEDCDLSLRLKLAGWSIKLNSDAVIYHNRTASRVGDSMWQIIKNRTGKRRKVKIWSFWGQWVIVLKYNKPIFSLKTRLFMWWYQLEILIFSFLFEQYLLKELFEIWRIRKQIKARREQLKIRVSVDEIEKIFI